jgi:hypothetical protein
MVWLLRSTWSHIGVTVRFVLQQSDPSSALPIRCRGEPTVATTNGTGMDRGSPELRASPASSMYERCDMHGAARTPMAPAKAGESRRKQAKAGEAGVLVPGLWR